MKSGLCLSHERISLVIFLFKHNENQHNANLFLLLFPGIFKKDRNFCAILSDPMIWN